MLPALAALATLLLLLLRLVPIVAPRPPPSFFPLVVPLSFLLFAFVPPQSVAFVVRSSPEALLLSSSFVMRTHHVHAT